MTAHRPAVVRFLCVLALAAACAPAETEQPLGPVTVRVVNTHDVALPGITVRVNGTAFETGADGTVEVPDPGRTYDATVTAGASATIFTAYLGLTTRTPVFRTSPKNADHHTTYRLQPAWTTGERPPEGHNRFAGLTCVSRGQAADPHGSWVTGTLAWSEPVTALGCTVMAFEYETDTAGEPSKYVLGVVQDVELLDGATERDLNPAPAAIGNVTATVEYVVPEGWTLDQRQLFFGDVPVRTITAATTSDAIPLPSVITNARLQASVSKDGRSSIRNVALSNAGGTTRIEFILPSDVTAPIAGAVDVAAGSTITFRSADANAVHNAFLRSSTGLFTLIVATASPTFAMPDLAALGITGTAGTKFTIEPNRIAPYASVDAYVAADALVLGQVPSGTRGGSVEVTLK